MGWSYSSLGSSALGDTTSSTVEHHKEVHAINSNARIVLEAQINVFIDAETEGSLVREVLTVEFIFLDLKKKIIMEIQN